MQEMPKNEQIFITETKTFTEADSSSLQNIRSERDGFDTHELMQRIQLYNNSC